ncbi:hypothetical protein [Microbacterium esteraromaticum]|uniref:hypothetical protein n=1 Tax=Microbacterium esteraromaticum TaxID=57043 RepID=UPI0019D321D0|nr:hypothetical protein [Microbacterium esteraromaticum]MBN7792402.1 hypothetical protein [Microbacterium esteraromaticum]
MTEHSERVVEKKTIGEVERIVHGSGLWDGTGPVEFSNDGDTWSETWAPTEAHPMPEFARVEVFRKDVRVPTKVTIRWDEQVPRADEFWAAKWVGAPMRHFGRTARMVGYRQTFRELLGDIVIEDEGDDRTAPTSQHAENTEDAAPAARDWAAEIAEAESAEMLDAIEKDGRAVRIFTADGPGTELWRSLRARRREIEKKWAEVESAWEAPAIADAADVPVVAADEVTDSPAPKPGAPRDYLPPMNRAARRKAARKKGRRR